MFTRSAGTEPGPGWADSSKGPKGTAIASDVILREANNLESFFEGRARTLGTNSAEAS